MKVTSIYNFNPNFSQSVKLEKTTHLQYIITYLLFGNDGKNLNFKKFKEIVEIIYASKLLITHNSFPTI